jgi:hypothetical protein
VNESETLKMKLPEVACENKMSVVNADTTGKIVLREVHDKMSSLYLQSTPAITVGNIHDLDKVGDTLDIQVVHCQPLEGIQAVAETGEESIMIDSMMDVAEVEVVTETEDNIREVTTENTRNHSLNICPSLNKPGLYFEKGEKIQVTSDPTLGEDITSSLNFLNEADDISLASLNEMNMSRIVVSSAHTMPSLPVSPQVVDSVQPYCPNPLGNRTMSVGDKTILPPFKSCAMTLACNKDLTMIADSHKSIYTAQHKTPDEANTQSNRGATTTLMKHRKNKRLIPSTVGIKWHSINSNSIKQAQKSGQPMSHIKVQTVQLQEDKELNPPEDMTLTHILDDSGISIPQTVEDLELIPEKPPRNSTRSRRVGAPMAKKARRDSQV